MKRTILTLAVLSIAVTVAPRHAASKYAFEPSDVYTTEASTNGAPPDPDCAWFVEATE